MLRVLILFFRAALKTRAQLALENLALRQQLAALNRKAPRPKLRRIDRIFWVFLSRIFRDWKSCLLIVQPATVIRWHRQGFKYYWRWKSRKPGRPRIDREIITLIHRMSRENPTWGTPRIQSELHLLGHEVAESTIDKYRIKPKSPGQSQTWRTFLGNHMHETIACDFFVVPTATFRLLFGFVVLHHKQRRIIHFNATHNPTSEWAALQLQQATHDDDLDIRFLLRDRDSIYGEVFRNKVKSLELEEVRTAPQSPWQNPYAERMIGSLRREILDHVIVLGENHLRRIVSGYLTYYHEIRPHQSLGRNAPIPRKVDPPENGQVISTPMVGGLHHRYSRAA